MTTDREIEAAPATLQERLRWYAENPVHQAHSGDYVPLDANWYDIGDKMTLHTLRWDLKTAADQLDTLAAALRAAEEREAKILLQAVEQREADMASTHQFFQMGVSAALEAARSAAARALEPRS